LGEFKVNRGEQLFGIDPRSLTAFRIGLGALLLADLAYRSLDFQAHYTELGILPRALYLDYFANVEIAWSLHLVLGNTTYTALLFFAQAIAALALVLGVHTRTAISISWLLLVSLHNRQPLVVSGSDMILRLMLFWSLFLPLAGPPSLDQRRAEPMQARIELSPASVALLVQVGLIYAFSLIHKLMDPAWTQRIAVQSAMQVEGVATALGRGLLAYPELLRVATASTLAFEFGAILLVFVPAATARIRIGVVIAMWGYHLLGIGGTMNLGLFEYVMALAWVPFLPPLFWDRVAPRWRSESAAAAPADRSRAGIARTVVVVLALSLVIIDNFVSLDRGSFRAAPWTLLRIPTRALALSQQWRLWSTPLHNRYYVFPACLAEMTPRSISTPGTHWIGTARGERLATTIGKYQLRLSRPEGRRLRQGYGEFLIREWNSEHGPEQHVVSLELVKLDARRADGPRSALPREVLWRVGLRPPNCGIRSGI